MKRDLRVSLGVASLGALFIGLGVFQICAGYAFAKVGGPVSRSERPVVYWVNVGFWFAFSLPFIVKAIKIYRGDDEDSEDGQDR